MLERMMIFKLALDLVMTFLMLLAMAYRVTGNAAHECLGLLLFVLFALHSAMNRHWFEGLFKGRYDVLRAVNTAVNLLLLLSMSLLLASGILISRDVFPSWGMGGGFSARLWHVMSAYWGLVLISIHVGMHWEMICGAAQKALKLRGVFGDSRSAGFRAQIVRLALSAAVLYGVYASFERQVGSKLFMISSFDFWDDERSSLFFFAELIGIMGLYVIVTYYARRFIMYGKRQKSDGRDVSGSRRR